LLISFLVDYAKQLINNFHLPCSLKASNFPEKISQPDDYRIGYEITFPVSDEIGISFLGSKYFSDLLCLRQISMINKTKLQR